MCLSGAVGHSAASFGVRAVVLHHHLLYCACVSSVCTCHCLWSVKVLPHIVVKDDRCVCSSIVGNYGVVLPRWSVQQPVAVTAYQNRMECNGGLLY
jgi:hypothetical protein